MDISTSVVGLSVLSPDGTLISLDCIDLRKLTTTWEKLDAVEAFLLGILRIHGPVSQCFVEENLKAFRDGFSSATTLVALARFNGMTSASARRLFVCDPQYVDFGAARRALNIAIVPEKKCGVSPKQQIHEQVAKMIPSWQWRMKTLSAGPRKGLTVLDEVCYDMADAYVVARAGLLGVGPAGKKPKKKSGKKAV